MRKLSLIIILLFFVGLTSSFEASLLEPDPYASPDDPGVIQVQVNNTLPYATSFSVGIFSPKPSWIYTESSKTLESGEVDVFNVTVTPDKYAVDSRYSFTAYVKASGANVSRELKGSFRVRRSKSLILEDFNLDRKRYMPGDEMTGSVKIRSISSALVRDYTVNVNWMEMNVEKTSSPILPGGTRELEFSMPVEEGQRPGDYELGASLAVEDQEVESSFINFSVGEVKDINVNRSIENNILTYRESVQVSNSGNSVQNYTLEEDVAGYLTPITGFSVAPDKRKSGGAEHVYQWNISLEPGETFTVKRKSNYWMPATALLGIIAALMVLKKLRNSVKIVKSIEREEESLKVSIEVENISDRTIEDAEIVDFVPDIAEVEKHFEMATPVVRRTSEGTKLVWDLESLEPGDQRVLQYRIRPKVEVEGGVELQEAEMKKDGEVFKKSNKLETDFRP